MYMEICNMNKCVSALLASGLGSLSLDNNWKEAILILVCNIAVLDSISF